MLAIALTVLFAQRRIISGLTAASVRFLSNLIVSTPGALGLSRGSIMRGNSRDHSRHGPGQIGLCPVLGCAVEAQGLGVQHAELRKTLA